MKNMKKKRTAKQRDEECEKLQNKETKNKRKDADTNRRQTHHKKIIWTRAEPECREGVARHKILEGVERFRPGKRKEIPKEGKGMNTHTNKHTKTKACR